MDKTFAETKGQAPFDWNLFLANPPTLDSLAQYDAQMLACSWVTCACGNQCAIIPRSDVETYHRRVDAPLDEALNTLGSAFYGNILDGDWPSARATLAAIEARSAVLIREELAKLSEYSRV